MSHHVHLEWVERASGRRLSAGGRGALLLFMALVAGLEAAPKNRGKRG